MFVQGFNIIIKKYIKSFIVYGKLCMVTLQ